MLSVEDAPTGRHQWLFLTCITMTFSAVLGQQGFPLCGRGNYFNLSQNMCTPCPPNTYMSKDNHNTIGCINCQTPVLYKKCHQVVLQNCNSEHPTVIGCEEGYFIESTPVPVGCHMSCSQCTKCQYEGQKCRHDMDSVCCPQPAMVVVEIEHVPVCQLPNNITASMKTLSTEHTTSNTPVSVTPACVHKATGKCQPNWHMLSPGKCMRYERKSDYTKAVESCASQGASLLGRVVDDEKNACISEYLQRFATDNKIWLKRSHSETNPRVFDLVSRTINLSTSWDDQYPYVCITHVTEESGVVVPDCPPRNASYCPGCLLVHVFNEVIDATIWCQQQGGSLLTDTVDSATMACVAALHPLETSGGFKLQKETLYLAAGTSHGRKNVYFCLTAKTSIKSSLADGSKSGTMLVIVFVTAVLSLLVVIICVVMLIRRVKCRDKPRSPNAEKNTYRNVAELKEYERKSLALRSIRGKQRLRYQERDVDVIKENEIIVVESAGTIERAVYTNDMCVNEEDQRHGSGLTSYDEEHYLRPNSSLRTYAHSPVSRDRSVNQIAKYSAGELKTHHTPSRKNVNNVVRKKKNKATEQQKMNVIAALHQPMDDKLYVDDETYEHYCDHIYEPVS